MMRLAILIGLLLSSLTARAQTGLSSVLFTNLSPSIFDVGLTRSPTELVKLNTNLLSGAQFWVQVPTDNGTLFPGVYYTNVYSTNLAAGLTPFFTVPNGYYCNSVFGTAGVPTNLAGITFAAYVTADSFTRRLNNTTTGTTNGQAGFALAQFGDSMSRPGDVLSISNSAAGATVQVVFRLIPDDGTIHVSRIYSFTNTPTKLYESPVDKWAVPWKLGTIPLNNGANCRVINDSGATRTNRMWMVPPGGTTDVTTLLATFTLANAAASTPLLTMLPPGYSIWFASDAADTGGEWVQFTWLEMDLPSAP